MEAATTDLNFEVNCLKKLTVHEKTENVFYENAAKYWKKVPATIEGMLGGFGFISQTDIKGSRQFLKAIFNTENPPGKEYALDCGAGIGRITKNLLMPIFEKVDLVEQNPDFLKAAENFIGKSDNIGNYYAVGLQDFEPEEEKYDVIWCQWVLGHLKDSDFVEFFKRCMKGLRKNGLIIVKENCTSSGKIEMDEEDSSVTRPLPLLHQLLNKADLHCIKQSKQNDMPKGIYPVYTLALVPKSLNKIQICSQSKTESSTTEEKTKI